MSFFVTIEGIEGSGKSTLRSRIAEMMPKSDGEILVTREPGATPLGLSIRSMLLDPSAQELDPIAELMLFCADRAQHLKDVIRPALARGATVVCDRFIHSTIAYQGFGRGLPLADLAALNQFITGGLEPDLVLLLDLDPAAGLERARARQERASGSFNVAELTAAHDSWSRFEQQELAFHSRVRDGFLQLAREQGGKFVVIDAATSAEEVSILAVAAIQRGLAKARSK